MNQTLSREEYIEQEYFFRVFRERLQEKTPSQEILKTVQEELLATTRLPMAVDFMRAEILHNGRVSDAMSRLAHYFSPFQAFVMARAEDDVARFDQITALEILEREARYRTQNATMPGLFVYQFECLSRNRLGYADGLKAMAGDGCYDDRWQKWILSLRNNLGAYELSELVYRASEHFQTRKRSQAAPGKTGQDRDEGETSEPSAALFGEQDGRIARANIGRDPLYFFAALQRQLNYPQVPLARKVYDETLPPFLESRLTKIEQRLKIVELEQKGGLDLTKFYRKDDDGSGTDPLKL
ncbi:MAG: hypothetical protein R3C49_27930 [Planctomycetaceae bacterium]